MHAHIASVSPNKTNIHNYKFTDNFTTMQIFHHKKYPLSTLQHIGFQ